MGAYRAMAVLLYGLFIFLLFQGVNAPAWSLVKFTLCLTGAAALVFLAVAWARGDRYSLPSGVGRFPFRRACFEFCAGVFRKAPGRLLGLAATVGGCILFGLLPACLVLWWHHSGRWAPDFARGENFPEWSVLALGYWLGCALLVFGPVFVIWSLILSRLLRRNAGLKYFGEFPDMVCGAILGALGAMLFLPAYTEAFPPNSGNELRKAAFLLLLMAAGATSGAWVGWRVYRERARAEQRQLPQFSLGTLIALTVMWSVLMGLFRP